jgi:hypothetical protein
MERTGVGGIYFLNKKKIKTMIDLNKIGVQEMSYESQKEVSGGFAFLIFIGAAFLAYMLYDLAN